MSSGQFPPSTPDWNNLEILHKNTLPPRASFHTYCNEQDALSRDVGKSRGLCLSGQWKFKLAGNPYVAPENFHSLSYDVSDWDSIAVPGMWQLQGFGKGPHYICDSFVIPVDPPNVPLDKNETGLYVTTFMVPKSFEKQQLRLRFEGVDSSFHVYINGREVGYSQGSRNPSEFDITSFINEQGENKLAVKVYQWCDGSYLEAQDQWRMSGIFRDVHLIAFPTIHILDFHVRTSLDEAYRDATLSVMVNVNKAFPVNLKLLDSSGKVVASKSLSSSECRNVFDIEILDPFKWTAESPYLYTLLLNTDECFVSQRVGFRQAEIRNGTFVVNGQSILFRGVNRHEHHPFSGRSS